jgi:hypothetical protein
MSPEYFDNLEQQLVAASQRMSHEHVVRRRRKWMGRRPILVALVAMMCATTAFAVSDQAPWSPPELTLRADDANVPPLIGAPTPTEITSFLGVLRRPQTDALTFFNGGTPGGIRTNGIRAVVPADPAAPTLVIVPYDEATAKGHTTNLKIWVTDRGAAGGKVNATPEILRRPITLGSVDGYTFGMAPDGVATVELTWPDEKPVEVPVRDNVYVAPSPGGTPFLPAVTWHDAQGAVVPALD